jgi:hypothetical protein
MSTPPFKKGDRVRFVPKPPSINLRRLRDPVCRAAAAKPFTITRVGAEQAPGVWDIDVDGPLSIFCLTSSDVQLDHGARVVISPSGITTVIAGDR